jgi:hypothetical protein
VGHEDAKKPQMRILPLFYLKKEAVSVSETSYSFKRLGWSENVQYNFILHIRSLLRNCRKTANAALRPGSIKSWKYEYYEELSKKHRVMNGHA